MVEGCVDCWLVGEVCESVAGVVVVVDVRGLVG